MLGRRILLGGAAVVIGIVALVAWLVLRDEASPQGNPTEWAQETCEAFAPPPGDTQATEVDAVTEQDLRWVRDLASSVTGTQDAVAIWADMPDELRIADCEYSRGTQSTVACPGGFSYYAHPPQSYLVGEDGRSIEHIIQIDYSDQETCE